MKESLKPGCTMTTTIEVDAGRSIAFMGDALRVYATPSMVQDVEHACRDLLKLHHEEGEDSVGARVEIDHLAPTLLGQRVTCEVSVAELALPRVAFEVVVRDELETVGRARHVRFVINTARQAERLAKKFDKLQSVRGGQ